MTSRIGRSSCCWEALKRASKIQPGRRQRFALQTSFSQRRNKTTGKESSLDRALTLDGKSLTSWPYSRDYQRCGFSAPSRAALEPRRVGNLLAAQSNRRKQLYFSSPVARRLSRPYFLPPARLFTLQLSRAS